MNESNFLWYLAASKPKQEQRALDNLKNQGVEAFTPFIRLTKVKRGKKENIIEPMFPGYLFLALSADSQMWNKVRSTRGVRDFIRFSGKPAVVDLKLIEQLKRVEASHQLNSKIEKLKSGDSVKILSGPFEGLEGIFLAETGVERSLILVDFLGKQSRLSVGSDQIIGQDLVD